MSSELLEIGLEFKMLHMWEKIQCNSALVLTGEVGGIPEYVERKILIVLSTKFNNW